MSVDRRRLVLGGALAGLVGSGTWAATLPPRLSARHAYVGNLNDTLLAVDADVPVPIASVSKLITASVILGADLPLDERIRVTSEDAVRSQHTASQLAVGSTWKREELLEWLLVASDNRAAAALARSFPGRLGGVPVQHAGTDHADAVVQLRLRRSLRAVRRSTGPARAISACCW